MPEKPSTVDSNALFVESMGHIKQSIDICIHSQERVGFRVRILIRAVMVGLVMTLGSIFFLIYLLTNQVDALSDTLDVITSEAAGIHHSMNDIQVVMMSFENQMEVLPLLNHSVDKINTGIFTTASGMQVITNNVDQMSSEINRLQSATAGLSGKVNVLDRTLLQVNKDMVDTTKPIRRFNQMNPLNYMP